MRPWQAGGLESLGSMASVIQPSFALGELSQDLSGRVDLEWYGKGLELCDNFYVLASGGVTLRPGTEFVCEVPAETASSTAGGASVSEPGARSEGASECISARMVASDERTKDGAGRKTRLIPFVFNAAEAYALLFTDKAMRVIRDGGLVTGEDGEPFVLALPYVESALADLRGTQSADVLYVVHPDYPPAKIMRYGHADWRYEALTFRSRLEPPAGVSASTSAGPTDKSRVTYSYKVTAYDGETGEESEASAAVSVVSKNLGLEDTVITVGWQPVPGAKEYKIYKESAGMYGLAGYSAGTEFLDRNYEGDYSVSPPVYENPFQGEGNYPSVATFVQQRLCFAGTRNNPQKIWMSRSGNYENFGRSNPTRDDDAVYLSICSSQVNWIRGMVTLRSLVALTGGSEWTISSGGGTSGGALTPASVNVAQQSAYGTAGLEPIIVGQSILLAQRGFTAVRDLAYSYDVDGYVGNDLTIRASHLLRGRAFTAWAYQNAPHGILWCARDDGVLLALTYVKEHQVFAWSRHHTDGAVEDLCVVNSDSRDELYMVARRTVGGRVRRYVERLAEPYRSDDMPMSRAWYADCGLRLDVGDGEPVSRLSGLAHLAGREVAVLVDGGPLDGLRVDEDGVLELPRPASVALVGLPYVGTVKSMRLNTGDQSGTGQGRRQTITRLTLRFRDSVGGEVGWERPGTDGGTLETQWTEIKGRTLQMANRPAEPFTGDRTQTPPLGWDSGGQFLLRQRDPLPMTLLCAIPDVTMGG